MLIVLEFTYIEIGISIENLCSLSGGRGCGGFSIWLTIILIILGSFWFGLIASFNESPPSTNGSLELPYQ
jgi:hypothetical protein